MKFREQLIQMNACPSVIDWVGDKTLEQVWAECERGDWMLWLAGNVGIDLKILTLAKVKTARLVQHLMDDQRSLEALDVAEKFANGEATLEELQFAARVAAYAVYAAYAADADADAVYAADAAAYAASVGAIASAAVVARAAAAVSYAGDFGSASCLKKASADICRDVIPLEHVRRGLEKKIK